MHFYIYFCFEVVSTVCHQVDKFEWPPILEACSRLGHKSDEFHERNGHVPNDRLDARATSLLVNGKANLSFRCDFDLQGVLL